MFTQYVPNKYQIARLRFWANRLHVLPRSQRLFDGVPPGFFLERQLFGQRFFCDVSRDGPQRLLYLEGERFIIEAPLLKRLLKPDFHAIDVGANIGYTTLLMASVICRGGSIVAIEPSPENLPELRRNIAINSLSDKVQIIEIAVGDIVGDVGLKGGINSGVAVDGESSPHRVHIDRIDNLFNKPVDFIKMDVEGYEVRAINGAMKILAEQRPILFLEVHPALIRAMGDSVERLFQTLQGVYSTIRCYEPAKTSGIAEKIMRLYFGLGVVTEIANIDNRITMDNYQNRSPFWMVCSP